MIISASRRTDIPAFYSEWFMNRLREGYVLIPNPYDRNRLGMVNLSPENVDCIVFWTKGPEPMLSRFSELDDMGYSYYVQFTLTPYGKDIERNLPEKTELTESFKRMSRQIGAARSVWRYDPVIIDLEHNVEWHTERFSVMCEELHGHTEKCIISFIDHYKNANRTFRTLTNDEIFSIAEEFSKIAMEHGTSLYTCAEETNLSDHGIEHSSCIDQGMIENIIGRRIEAKNDTNQRPFCNCIESVDIGTYNTCTHGCTYCYATSHQNAAVRCLKEHDPKAPMIIGYPAGKETVNDRTTPSQKVTQRTLF